MSVDTKETATQMLDRHVEERAIQIARRKVDDLIDNTKKAAGGLLWHELQVTGSISLADFIEQLRESAVKEFVPQIQRGLISYMVYSATTAMQEDNDSK